MFMMNLVKRTLAPFRPREPEVETVVQGTEHIHAFAEVPWDHARLGPSAVDFDKDEDCPDIYAGGPKPIKFPMCTYKVLYRCSVCGEERIESVRALI